MGTADLRARTISLQLIPLVQLAVVVCYALIFIFGGMTPSTSLGNIAFVLLPPLLLLALAIAGRYLRVKLPLAAGSRRQRTLRVAAQMLNLAALLVSLLVLPLGLFGLIADYLVA